MKVSIAVSLLILAIGAAIGWHDRQQLVVIRADENQLAIEAAKVGNSPGNSQAPTFRPKRDRPTHHPTVKLSPAELIELTKEIFNRSGNLSIHTNSAIYLKLYDSLAALGSAEIGAVLAEIATHLDLDEQIRTTLSFCCITVLANDHPQAALELFSSSPELFTEGDRGRSLVLTALACLAKNDHIAALKWLRDHPDHATDQARGDIISAVAEQDPRLAFQLITDLDLKITDYAVRQLLSSQKTLEAKSTALAGLRGYLARIEDEKIRSAVAKNSYGGFAGPVGKGSFESLTQWISKENLSTQEVSDLAEGLYISTNHGEIGKWIGWFRESLPEKQADRKAWNLIGQWADSDYQAATQWALTQPIGKDRENTLTHIYQRWPKEDPDGAADFAEEHGLK